MRSNTLTVDGVKLFDYQHGIFTNRATQAWKSLLQQQRRFLGNPKRLSLLRRNFESNLLFNLGGHLM